MAKNAPPAKAKGDHEETHDEWFLRMVEEGLAEADSPDTVWIPHEEVMAEAEARREELLAMAKARKTS